MAFEDCNMFLSEEERANAADRATKRWGIFFLLAISSGVGVHFAGGHGLWAFWTIIWLARAFWIGGTN